MAKKYDLKNLFPVEFHSPKEIANLREEQRIRAKYPQFQNAFFYGFFDLETSTFYPYKGGKEPNLKEGIHIDKNDVTPTGWLDAEGNRLAVGDSVVVDNGGLKRATVIELLPLWHHMGCGWCILPVRVQLTKDNKAVTVKKPAKLLKA